MHLTRSLQTSTFLLSFATWAGALVLQSRPDEDVQKEKRFAAVDLEHGELLEGVPEKRQDSQELECPNDRWQQLLDSNPTDRVVTFCNEWLGIGPATEVVEWTPTMFVSCTDIQPSFDLPAWQNDHN